MSFKKAGSEPMLFEMGGDSPDIFRKELEIVLDGAADNPRLQPIVVAGDAREPSMFLTDRYDTVITSPPRASAH